jgi:hypothetical protein
VMTGYAAINRPGATGSTGSDPTRQAAIGPASGRVRSRRVPPRSTSGTGRRRAHRYPRDRRGRGPTCSRRLRHLRSIAMKPVAHGCLRDAVMTRRLDQSNPVCRLQDLQPLCRRVLPPLPRLIYLRCHLRPRSNEYPPSDRPGFQVSITVDDVRQRQLPAGGTHGARGRAGARVRYAPSPRVVSTYRS